MVSGQTLLTLKSHSCHFLKLGSPVASMMVWGCISALGKAQFHFCDGSINAEKFTEILQQHMLPSRPHLFQGHPCIFQHDNYQFVFFKLKNKRNFPSNSKKKNYIILPYNPATAPQICSKCIHKRIIVLKQSWFVFWSCLEDNVEFYNSICGCDIFGFIRGSETTSCPCMWGSAKQPLFMTTVWV